MLKVLVSGFVLALLAFGFLSGSGKRFSSPVCGFGAISDSAVALFFFASLNICFISSSLLAVSQLAG